MADIVELNVGGEGEAALAQGRWRNVRVHTGEQAGVAAANGQLGYGRLFPGR
jgi:hypothetical protein